MFFSKSLIPCIRIMYKLRKAVIESAAVAHSCSALSCGLKLLIRPQLYVLPSPFHPPCHVRSIIDQKEKENHLSSDEEEIAEVILNSLMQTENKR